MHQPLSESLGIVLQAALGVALTYHLHHEVSRHHEAPDISDGPGQVHKAAAKHPILAAAAEHGLDVREPLDTDASEGSTSALVTQLVLQRTEVAIAEYDRLDELVRVLHVGSRFSDSGLKPKGAGVEAMDAVLSNLISVQVLAHEFRACQGDLSKVIHIAPSVAKSLQHPASMSRATPWPVVVDAYDIHHELILIQGQVEVGEVDAGVGAHGDADGLPVYPVHDSDECMVNKVAQSANGIMQGEDDAALLVQRAVPRSGTPAAAKHCAHPDFVVLTCTALSPVRSFIQALWHHSLHRAFKLLLMLQLAIEAYFSCAQGRTVPCTTSQTLKSHCTCMYKHRSCERCSHNLPDVFMILSCFPACLSLCL